MGDKNSIEREAKSLLNENKQDDIKVFLQFKMMNNQVLDHNGNEIEIEAFHPGEFLLEEIEERALLKKDVAKALAILPHHLSEIFAGKRNISAKMAVKLEKLFGSSAHYWLGLQMAFDLYQAKQQEEMVA